MKRSILNILGIAIVTLSMVSCRKDSLYPIDTLEPGVYGQGKLVSGTFLEGNDAGSKVSMQLKWIDVNRILTMQKQELFVTFYQDYIDINGNPATANHGTKSLLTMDCKGNNEASTFDITPAQIYTLFSAAQFNYGNGAVAVFGASRPSGARFKVTDYFQLTWAFTGSNGLVYKYWSTSIPGYSGAPIYSNQPAIASNADVWWGVE
ncbi:MAG: hypothetical protein ACO29O_05145 [Chitinophagaceae bacterium]